MHALERNNYKLPRIVLNMSEYLLKQRTIRNLDIILQVVLQAIEDFTERIAVLGELSEDDVSGFHLEFQVCL